MKGLVISASRRTDIPAYHTEWFIERLRQGYIGLTHPFTGRVERVSLRAESLHSIVFWSKNYTPLLSRLDEVEQVCKNLFFHFTITALGHPFEPCSPPKEQAVDALRYLARRYSPQNVLWRFDPIVLCHDYTDEFYIDGFSRLCEQLSGSVNRCYIGFVNLYDRVLRRFEGAGLSVKDAPFSSKLRLTERLCSIARGNGIVVSLCCEPYLSRVTGNRAGCIDGRALKRLFGGSPSIRRAPTRRACLCTQSVDIGSYNSCPAGCLYCYANP